VACSDSGFLPSGGRLYYGRRGHPGFGDLGMVGRREGTTLKAMLPSKPLLKENR
jgi:hypothetical protein